MNLNIFHQFKIELTAFDFVRIRYHFLHMNEDLESFLSCFGFCKLLKNLYTLATGVAVFVVNQGCSSLVGSFVDFVYGFHHLNLGLEISCIRL
jgi:hypothetical protein